MDNKLDLGLQMKKLCGFICASTRDAGFLISMLEIMRKSKE